MTNEQIAELRALAEKATPGKWQADNFLCEGSHALRIGEPWRNGQPLATIAHVEHNWNDCGPHDRRISWKEAEANAALIVALRNNLPTILTALEALPVMREALEAVIASRDAHCFEREQFKSGGSYGDYWSPSTSMVESSAIAKARAALASLPKEVG